MKKVIFHNCKSEDSILIDGKPATQEELDVICLQLNEHDFNQEPPQTPGIGNINSINRTFVTTPLHK